VFEPSVPVVSTLHAAVSEATEEVPTQERDALLVVLYENTIIGDTGTLWFSLMMGSVASSDSFSISHGVAEKSENLIKNKKN